MPQLGKEIFLRFGKRINTIKSNILVLSSIHQQVHADSGWLVRNCFYFLLYFISLSALINWAPQTDPGEYNSDTSPNT